MIHTIYTIYTIPAHIVIYYAIQYSAYILIRSYTLIPHHYHTTTSSHDLLLLHKDIHIIPVYTSPSAMPYIIIHHTYII